MAHEADTRASHRTVGPRSLLRAGMRGVSLAGAAARRVSRGVPRELLSRDLPLVHEVAATGAPDAGVAVARYRDLAGSYDLLTAAGGVYRRQAVHVLAPAAGETIVDVGCGTGLNFDLIECGIGPGGRLIGLDLSAEMLDRARERVEEHGWENVVLLQGGAQEAQIPWEADAALLCGVHDVMRSPPALANVLRQLVAGGRVIAAGPKWTSWSRPDGVALNLSTWAMNRDYVTTFEGFARPWSHLAGLVDDLEVHEVFLGGGYIARARTASSRRSHRRSR